jgi:hypothetical protein
VDGAAAAQGERGLEILDIRYPVGERLRATKAQPYITAIIYAHKASSVVIGRICDVRNARECWRREASLTIPCGDACCGAVRCCTHIQVLHRLGGVVLDRTGDGKEKEENVHKSAEYAVLAARESLPTCANERSTRARAPR